MSAADYIAKLQRVRSPRRAAALVRAFACHMAASMKLSAAERRAIVAKAESLAAALETHGNGMPDAWRVALKAVVHA